MYDIKEYTYEKARELSLDIKPSSRKGKKIDVYKDCDYLCSIGDIKYKDYPTYLIEDGKEEADHRRVLYHFRHKKDLHYFKGFLSMYLLW